jgi:hypothetical protein
MSQSLDDRLEVGLCALDEELAELCAAVGHDPN